MGSFFLPAKELKGRKNLDSHRCQWRNLKHIRQKPQLKKKFIVGVRKHNMHTEEKAKQRGDSGVGEPVSSQGWL